jgi:hypothetical protein
MYTLAGMELPPAFWSSISSVSILELIGDDALLDEVACNGLAALTRLRQLNLMGFKSVPPAVARLPPRIKIMSLMGCRGLRLEAGAYLGELTDLEVHKGMGVRITWAVLACSPKLSALWYEGVERPTRGSVLGVFQEYAGASGGRIKLALHTLWRARALELFEIYYRERVFYGYEEI